MSDLTNLHLPPIGFHKKTTRTAASFFRTKDPIHRQLRLRIIYISIHAEAVMLSTCCEPTKGYTERFHAQLGTSNPNQPNFLTH